MRRRKTKWKILCQTSNFCLGETNVEICWDPTTLQLRNTWCSDDLFPFTISNGKELLLKMKEDNEKKGEERRGEEVQEYPWTSLALWCNESSTNMISAAERVASRLILVLAKGNNLITFTFPTLMKLFRIESKA